MEIFWQAQAIAQLLIERRLLFFNEFAHPLLKYLNVPSVREIIADLSDVIELNEQIFAEPTEGKGHLNTL